MLINSILLIIFIVSSAFFSASETALFSLSRSRLRKLKEKYPSAKRLNAIFKNPGLFLIVIVFGNMLVNIGLASLTVFIFVQIWEETGIIFSILFSGVLILFLGEILPKTIAFHASERVSLICGPILLSIAQVIRPLIQFIKKIVDKLTNFLVKEKEPFSEEGLKTALILGKEGGSITKAEKEIISYVLEFKDTQASEILTPRVEVQGIEEYTFQEEVERMLKERRHSKFPVYKESLDNITGILYAKDAFLNFDRNWKEFIRKPIFVPESKKIDDLLKVFLDTNERIAIVLDEYGGTSGLVTLEDIEEEIFGEIYDEFEIPHKMIEKISKDTWRVYGKIPMKTLNLECELNLPEEEDTLAGFILSKLERLPHSQDRFQFKGIAFIIERVTVKRIISVLISIPKKC